MRVILSLLSLALFGWLFFAEGSDGLSTLAAVPALAFLGKRPNGEDIFIDGMSIQNQERAEWDYIVRSNMAMGIPNIVPMPGTLRAEFVLGSQSSFQFAILEDQQTTSSSANVFASEIRLNKNDAFYIRKMGIVFQTFTAATGNPARAKAPLQSFANALTVAAGGFGPLHAPLIEAIYNGSTSLRVNDRVMIPAIRNSRFKSVGPAQGGLAVSAAAADNVMTASQWNEDTGVAMVEVPLTQLNGQANNIFSVKIPTTVDFPTALAAQSVVAVLLLDGWLCQNAGAARVANG